MLSDFNNRLFGHNSEKVFFSELFFYRTFFIKISRSKKILLDLANLLKRHIKFFFNEKILNKIGHMQLDDARFSIRRKKTETRTNRSNLKEEFEYLVQSS